MITTIKVTVTAFITSKNVDAEKSESFTIDIGRREPRDWKALMGALINRAIKITPDNFPFADGKLMTPKQVTKFLDRDGDGIGKKLRKKVKS